MILSTFNLPKSHQHFWKKTTLSPAPQNSSYPDDGCDFSLLARIYCHVNDILMCLYVYAIGEGTSTSEIWNFKKFHFSNMLCFLYKEVTDFCMLYM